MKKFNYPSKKLLNTAILAMGIHLVGCNSQQMQHNLIPVEAPFETLMIQGFNEPWFDTEGEFLALKAASPIWEFLGEEGLPKVKWPDSYDLSAVGRKLAYYRRDNLHGISAFDWVQMVEFADKLFGK